LYVINVIFRINFDIWLHSQSWRHPARWIFRKVSLFNCDILKLVDQNF